MKIFMQKYKDNWKLIKHSSPLRLEFWSGLQALLGAIGILITYPNTPNKAYVLLFSIAVIIASGYQLGSLINLSLNQRHNSNWLLCSTAICMVIVLFFDKEFALMMGFSLNSLMTFDCFLSTYRSLKAIKEEEPLKPGIYGKQDHFI